MTLDEVLQLVHLRPAGEPLDISGLLSTLQRPQPQPSNDMGEFSSWAMGQHQKGMSAGKEGASPHQTSGQVEAFKPKDWRGLLPKSSPGEEEPAAIPRPHLPEASFTMRPAPALQPQPFVNLMPEQYQPQRYLFLNAAPPRGLL